MLQYLHQSGTCKQNANKIFFICRARLKQVRDNYWQWLQMVQKSINKYIFIMSSKFLSREPHKPPTTFISGLRKSLNQKQGINKFVPFANQRDGLGRLIRNRDEQVDLEPLPLKKQCSYGKLSTQMSRNNTPRDPMLIHLEADLIQESIDRSFQYKNSPERKPYEKTRREMRKNSLQLAQSKSSKEEVHLPLIKVSPQKQLQRPHLISKLKIKMITEPQSSQLIQKPQRSQVIPVRKISLNIKEGTHEIICSRYYQQSTQQTNSPRKISIIHDKLERKASEHKIVAAPNYVNNRIQNREIEELTRYNTLKTLGLKLTENYEQGHNNFIYKMRETKKLAYKIKLGLQAT